MLNSRLHSKQTLVILRSSGRPTLSIPPYLTINLHLPILDLKQFHVENTKQFLIRNDRKFVLEFFTTIRASQYLIEKRIEDLPIRK